MQRPLPSHIPTKALQATIHPLKDVEGMHPASIGNIVYNELELGPCTAVAAVDLLRSTKMTLRGLEATVIGHSEIVGKPIAFLLMAEGATVTVCHHMTREVAIHSRRADAVFVAVGQPGLLTGDGITEEIINALTRLGDLRVAARTSSFAFKGTTRDIGDVGAKLNVTTVLEVAA